MASFAEHSPRAARRYHRMYSGGGDDHPHVHGANLGVRSDAYRAVGGWSAIASGEDHALWNAVRRAGYPTLSTRSIHVVTSGRRVGRAPDGFAAHLCALGGGAAPTERAPARRAAMGCGGAVPTVLGEAV